MAAASYGGFGQGETARWVVIAWASRQSPGTWEMITEKVGEENSTGGGGGGRANGAKMAPLTKDHKLHYNGVWTCP